MSKTDIEYLRKVFSIGLGIYENVLLSYGIVSKKAILDVGCGPGQWCFAASKLNPEATIIGIDPNPTFIDFANRYKEENHIDNCTFMRMSYEKILEKFNVESFDVIFCNGVLMYIDVELAIKIFSKVLRPRGILLMLHNHHVGYYLHSLIEGLINKDLEKFLYSLRVLLVSSPALYFLKKSKGHKPIFFSYLYPISRKYGITLFEVETKPKLHSLDGTSFLGFPYVKSFIGLKTKRFV